MGQLFLGMLVPDLLSRRHVFGPSHAIGKQYIRHLDSTMTAHSYSCNQNFRELNQGLGEM